MFLRVCERERKAEGDEERKEECCGEFVEGVGSIW
jgi:hypothetical protein